MTGYLLWVFLLAIWHTLLFFGKDYGLNVALFIIPLMYYLYWLLKKNNKIVNKKGLLFIIPIVLLSITYVLFDMQLFKALNIMVIPVLIALMIIFVTNETYHLWELVKRVFIIFFVPYKYIAEFYRVTVSKIGERLKVSDKGSKVLKSIIIVVPITILIIALLSSADMIFGNIFGELLKQILKVLRFEFLDHLLARITLGIIIFFVLGCTTMYIIYDSFKEKVTKKEFIIKDLFTTKLLVTVLNVVYVIFDFIQIKSLVFHSVSNGINYAEYARRGFFELLVVSLINLAIILITRKFETKENEKEYNYIKIMNVIMIFLTLVIIASSFLRMHMYEAEFGYTVLRLLVFVALITEAILMIPTVMYVFNKDVNIVKSYMIIILAAYVCVNYMNMDYLIAKRNINRYYYTKDVDLDYLENYGSDNIPLLINLYNNTNEEEIKNEINNYLYDIKYNINNDEKPSILEFNLARYKAKKALNKTELKPYYFYEYKEDFE